MSVPNPLPTDPSDLDSGDGPPLSLARGALGIGLIHLARGSPAPTSHAWLSSALASGCHDPAGHAGLFRGLPAVAFTLAHTPPDHYHRARTAVRAHLRALAEYRLKAAHARIDTGALASFNEYDLVSGLTGIGVALWSADPEGPILDHVLAYLVRLTQPVRHEGQEFPGWWVHHGPLGRPSRDFSDGHANTGMAHGIAGVLSMLAIAYRSGRVVSGHREAIEILCTALDTCRRHDEIGIWWPGWISTDRTETFARPGPPSWCYGTPGLARSQQLAALALGDRTRRRRAEQAMDTCLAGISRLDRLTTAGLCHGPAGVLRVLNRMSEDQAAEPRQKRLNRHLSTLREYVASSRLPHQGMGLLEGRGGTVLSMAPDTGLQWDRCLLLV
jgi:hypothetical protein